MFLFVTAAAARVSGARPAWRVTVLVVWLLVLLGLLLTPISEPSIPGQVTFPGMDKVAHFGLFAVAEAAFVFVAVFLRRPVVRLLAATAVAILLGAATELAQSLIPLRDTSLLDFAADLAGIAVGLAVCTLVLRVQVTARSGR